MQTHGEVPGMCGWRGRRRGAREALVAGAQAATQDPRQQEGAGHGQGRNDDHPQHQQRQKHGLLSSGSSAVTMFARSDLMTCLSDAFRQALSAIAIKDVCPVVKDFATACQDPVASLV
jgi:hypothetical protein